MFDVVALGELLIDFVCQSKNDAGYPTLAANPGGAPAIFWPPCKPTAVPPPC